MFKAFDFLVLDPPYVTRDVWKKYALSINFLLAPEGKLLLSTLDDNKDFIFELTGSRPVNFRPYIPSLIYQFSFYSNYSSPSLEVTNTEIPCLNGAEEEKRVLSILGLNFD